MELLSLNKLNRPLSDSHVRRLVAQIAGGKWKFNADAIRLTEAGDILDGQHRLWAVVEAKTAIETLLVRGIEQDAFETIDTLRKPRSAADVVAINGTTRHRNVIAAALQWLVRWERGVLAAHRRPENRVENADVKAALYAHPGIVHAVEAGMRLRGIANPSILSFLYYVFSQHNAVIADRMMETLRNPVSVPLSDPFFRLRAYFTSDHLKRKEPEVSIALAIKAANAAYADRKVQALTWRNQGKGAEDFPTLEIGQ